MNPQETILSFFNLTENVINTAEPEGTHIRKRKQCGLNYKSLLQFILMIVQIIFQLVILVVDCRRSIYFYFCLWYQLNG
jgi:Na+/melibiose symporter-like transporter